MIKVTRRMKLVKLRGLLRITRRSKVTVRCNVYNKTVCEIFCLCENKEESRISRNI